MIKSCPDCIGPCHLAACHTPLPSGTGEDELQQERKITAALQQRNEMLADDFRMEHTEMARKLDELQAELTESKTRHDIVIGKYNQIFEDNERLQAELTRLNAVGRKLDETTLKDERTQAEKRGDKDYADAYMEGLQDGFKQALSKEGGR